MKPLIGVTGATGYVGGRLVPRLLEEGYRVRCLARDPAKLEGRPWRSRVEVTAGDVLDPDSLAPFVEGVHAVYYLVHSLAAGEHGFEQRDLEAARNLAAAAGAAGVERILYLGGLARPHPDLSRHLESRLDTGNALREGPVPVTELRAAIIVGSGSMSFEMIRALVHRLPIMITPRWLSTRCQPIAIDDVLRYLVGCLEEPRTAADTFDIGGGDVVTYRDMMMTYARVRGLRRVMVPVPVLTPRLSSYWIDLVTPIPAAYARPLVEGLRNEVVVHDHRLRDLVPFEPMDYEEAVLRAVDRTRRREVETRWTEAALPYVRPLPTGYLGTELVDERAVETHVSPAVLWDVVEGIGGRRGWYAHDFLWDLRGFLDRLMGGVGMRRGRRDPDRLRPGDALDFWRVQSLRPGSHLLLHAEMKVPGEAWLEFRVLPLPERGSRLVMRARFLPAPILGPAYWYSLLPVHDLVFRGMLRAMVDRAEADAVS